MGIKSTLKKWSDALIATESKYWVVNKVKRFIAILLVNSYMAMVTSAISSFVLFAIAFAIPDDQIIGDYIFLLALIIFLGVMGTYFIIGMYYALAWVVRMITGKED